MRKDKENVTTNDVLEALSMRINDVLRPNRKDNKRNNAYFWIFKFGILILYLLLITWFLTNLKNLGVVIIYGFSNSLRSVYSAIWVTVIVFINNLIIIKLLYENLLVFTKSPYYKNLYATDKKMLKNKKKVFKFVKIALQVLAGLYMAVVAAVAACILFAILYMITMVANGITVISPFIIFAALFAICFFTFRHIQEIFFNSKNIVNKNYFILCFGILILGILCFGYETRSFEQNNVLPDTFELTKKEKVFKLDDNQKVNLINSSKLDNVKIKADDNLHDEIKIVFEYYKTADVRYVYQLNDEDNLNLMFVSNLKFEIGDTFDVFDLFTDTFKNKTIYNYNLFKYPNIYIYANTSDL
jgi:hypothetical protein